MTPEEIAAVVEVAHAAGLKVAAHAHGARSIKEAILAGADTIEHASLIDDEAIELARQHGVALSMDVYNGDYIDTEGRAAGLARGVPAQEPRDDRGAAPGIHRARTRPASTIVYGTDAAVYPHGLNARQFPIMVERGMTPMEAIQSATSVAAQLHGVGGSHRQPAAGTFRRPHRGEGRSARGHHAPAGRRRRDQGRARLQAACGWRLELNPQDGEADLYATAATGSVTRLAPNLLRIVAPNPSPLTGPGTNTYVLGSQDSYLVIDPGPDDVVHLERILAATNGRTRADPVHALPPGPLAGRGDAARPHAGAGARAPTPQDDYQDESYAS